MSPARFKFHLLFLLTFIVIISCLLLASLQRSRRHRFDQDLSHDPRVRYDDHQVVRVQVTNTTALKFLADVVEKHALDNWSPLRLGFVDIRLPPTTISIFRELVPLPFSVIIQNVQSIMALSETKGEASPFQRFSSYSLSSFFDHYRTHEELVEFMEKLHDRYPDVVELIELGESWEGRRLLGVRIRAKKTGRHGLEDDNDWEWEYVDEGGEGHNARKRRKRHAIVITAGQHAREWISVMTAAFIAHELATKHSDKHMHETLRFFDFHIFPTINPDGYVYSHATDRMWRKNRQPTDIEYCLGTDLNHNWGYRWGDDGTGTNPCSDNYRGPEAFSAPETRRLAEYIDSLKRLISFIDLHAYSQYWMYPYAAECDKVPRDNEDLVELAIGAVRSLREVHNTQFGIGSACSLLYKASGNAIDWTYVEADVKYSYYLELRDTGTYGFLLPPKQIRPSGEETLAGVLTVAKFVMERETL